jgi:hypothetical protein
MAMQLLLDLATLAENLAQLREAQQRTHQAAAARLAAQQLRTMNTSVPTSAAGDVRVPAFTGSSRRPRPPAGARADQVRRG